MISILTVGEVMRAAVTRTEVYGVYLTHQGREILVPILDNSWVPVVQDCRDSTGPGDEFDVKILGTNEQVGICRRSIKDARPEDNPRPDPSVYQPGTAWTWKVTHLISANRPRGGLLGFIVESRSGVSGLIKAGNVGGACPSGMSSRSNRKRRRSA